MRQHRRSSPDLTVRDLLRLVGTRSGRRDRVVRLLSVEGPSRRTVSRVSQQSGSERRRLDFATAVYGGPELMALDQPTTGLASQSRDNLWDAVDRLRERGATGVLTSHLENARQLTARIGLIDGGMLRQEGTVTKLARTLRSVISFVLPPDAPEPPVIGTLNWAFDLESPDLQLDLHRLPVWAQDTGVELKPARPSHTTSPFAGRSMSPPILRRVPSRCPPRFARTQVDETS